MLTNLRDLHYFVTVARLGHFGHAAEVCHVSQPTLSMQIKKLEDLLGVKLLERSQPIRLTTIGEAVAHRAEKLLDDARQLVDIARLARNPLSGELKLGLFPTLAPYLLPAILPAIRLGLPAIDLVLAEEKTAVLLERLARGELDGALLALPEDQAFEQLPLFTERFLLAVPPGHRLAKRKKLNLQDLRHEQLLLLDEGHCLREQALSVCQSIGAGVARHFRATSLETLRQMVAGGSAVTLMPELAVRQGDGLAYLPFTTPAPHREIGLLWRKGSARGVLFSKLAEIIRQAALPVLAGQ